ARSVTSWCGEMNVQVFSCGVCEKRIDCGFNLLAVDQLETDHHALVIEGSHGQHALPELLGHSIDLIVCLVALAHEDREAHAIRRLDCQMLVVDENEGVPGSGIRQTDPARIAGIPIICDATYGAVLGKLRVWKRKQVFELLGRKGLDAEGHD